MERLLQGKWLFWDYEYNTLRKLISELSEKAQEYYNTTSRWVLSVFPARDGTIYTQEFETITKFDSKEELDKYICNLYDEEHFLNVKNPKSMEELKSSVESNVKNINNEYIEMKNKKDTVNEYIKNNNVVDIQEKNIINETNEINKNKVSEVNEINESNEINKKSEIIKTAKTEYEKVSFSEASKINTENVTAKKRKVGLIIGVPILFIIAMGVVYIIFGNKNSKWVQDDLGYHYKIFSIFDAKGLTKISDKYYYFDDNGIMQTGKVNVGKEKFFFDGEGAAINGFVQDGNEICFCDESGKAMKNVWANANSEKSDATNGIFYFDENGYLVKNKEIVIDGKNYVFDALGYKVIN